MSWRVAGACCQARHGMSEGQVVGEWSRSVEHVKILQSPTASETVETEKTTRLDDVFSVGRSDRLTRLTPPPAFHLLPTLTPPNKPPPSRRGLAAELLADTPYLHTPIPKTSRILSKHGRHDDHRPAHARQRHPPRVQGAEVQGRQGFRRPLPPQRGTRPSPQT